jgi:hypothetical protein
MQLRIRFLVTLIKTPRMALFPSFYRWLTALQRTLSGLTNDSTTIEPTAGFTKDISGHHK